jgi:transposase, IS5 family
MYAITHAADHDSVVLETLLEMSDGGQILYGDSAYVAQEEIIDECHMTSKIHEKGYRNKPLTDKQKASNREKSKIRARVFWIVHDLLVVISDQTNISKVNF